MPSFLIFFCFFKKKSFLIFKLILNFHSNCLSNRNFNENIDMINCLISNISSSQFGGVIFINSAFSLIINDTTFYECSSSFSGGAIYFING